MASINHRVATNKSKSPHSNSNSRSPDFVKLNPIEYKKNQLIQHLKQIRKFQEPRPLTQEEQMAKEVEEFKREIEKKYSNSRHNLNYRFPLEQLNYVDTDEDEELHHLKEFGTYSLKDQNNDINRQISQRKLIQDIQDFSKDIYSKLNNLMVKHDEPVSKARVKTEGDDHEMKRLVNNFSINQFDLKKQQQDNYFKKQLKEQVKRKVFSPQKFVNKSTSKSNSPQSKLKIQTIKQFLNMNPNTNSRQFQSRKATPDPSSKGKLTPTLFTQLQQKKADQAKSSTRDGSVGYSSRLQQQGGGNDCVVKSFVISNQKQQNIQNGPNQNSSSRLPNYYLSNQNGSNSHLNLLRKYQTDKEQKHQNSQRINQTLILQITHNNINNISNASLMNKSNPKSQERDVGIKIANTDKLREILKKS